MLVSDTISPFDFRNPSQSTWGSLAGLCRGESLILGLPVEKFENLQTQMVSRGEG